MTIREIQKFLENMKISVTRMVMMPENSWVNPSNSPSDNTSVSVMMRLTMSPELCLSRYESGSF